MGWSPVGTGSGLLAPRRPLKCPDGQGPDRDGHGPRAVTRLVQRVKRKVSRIVSTTGTHKTVTKTASPEGPQPPSSTEAPGTADDRQGQRKTQDDRAIVRRTPGCPRGLGLLQPCPTGPVGGLSRPLWPPAPRPPSPRSPGPQDSWAQRPCGRPAARPLGKALPSGSLAAGT